LVSSERDHTIVKSIVLTIGTYDHRNPGTGTQAILSADITGTVAINQTGTAGRTIGIISTVISAIRVIFDAYCGHGLTDRRRHGYDHTSTGGIEVRRR
jgi:hypothetical protein